MMGSAGELLAPGANGLFSFTNVPPGPPIMLIVPPIAWPDDALSACGAIDGCPDAGVSPQPTSAVIPSTPVNATTPAVRHFRFIHIPLWISWYANCSINILISYSRNESAVNIRVCKVMSNKHILCREFIYNFRHEDQYTERRLYPAKWFGVSAFLELQLKNPRQCDGG